MDTSNPDPQSYVLSEVESQSIFERAIIPAELGAFVSSSDGDSSNDTQPTTCGTPPLAVLLVGQTGAGKTRAAPALKAAMLRVRARSNPTGTCTHRPLAHLVADAYKAYHPSHAALHASRPSMASPATSLDARRWLAQACALAASRRVDVLLETAARHPSDFAALATLFRHAAYRVEVVVLAVPAPLSRLGVLARFYGRRAEGGAGAGMLMPARLTPRQVHDASYAGLLEAAAFVDADPREEGGGGGVVDQVVVVRRGNLVAFANERVGSAGTWKLGPGATASAVRAERERPLTPAERAGAQEDLSWLRALDVSGLDTELAEIEGLLRPLLVPSDDAAYAPLRPLSLPGSARDESFDVEAGLRLGVMLP
ncbi:zeta toxin-domain-containing protein [Hypoxylon sp. NC1633]|nr:zeta toxin-domain-containing protein [Hypoxylon sp. NC1633]